MSDQYDNAIERLRAGVKQHDAWAPSLREQAQRGEFMITVEEARALLERHAPRPADNVFHCERCGWEGRGSEGCGTHKCVPRTSGEPFQLPEHKPLTPEEMERLRPYAREALNRMDAVSAEREANAKRLETWADHWEAEGDHRAADCLMDAADAIRGQRDGVPGPSSRLETARSEERYALVALLEAKIALCDCPPDKFCESFGCATLRDLVATIQARGAARHQPTPALVADDQIEPLDVIAGRALAQKAVAWVDASSPPDLEEVRAWVASVREALPELCNALEEARRDVVGLRDALTLPVKDRVGALRDAGWRVGVHNDYALNGRLMTFWLFTHPATGRYVKGEGATDLEALDHVEAAVRDVQT